MGSGGPLTSFFLGSYWYCRGALPLRDGIQRGGFVALGGADVDDDDEHTRGGWSPSEAILAAFPPSKLLPRQPSVSLLLCFISPHRHPLGTPSGPFL
jgi:hypothetical protein